RSGQGYALQVEPPVEGYDLSRAFALISRQRVAGIGVDGSLLALDLACTCHAVAFESASGQLVIDIRDGPPPADSEFEAVLGPESPAAAPDAGGDFSLLADAPLWAPPDALMQLPYALADSPDAQ